MACTARFPPSPVSSISHQRPIVYTSGCTATGIHRVCTPCFLLVCPPPFLREGRAGSSMLTSPRWNLKLETGRRGMWLTRRTEAGRCRRLDDIVLPAFGLGAGNKLLSCCCPAPWGRGVVGYILECDWTGRCLCVLSFSLPGLDPPVTNFLASIALFFSFWGARDQLVKMVWLGWWWQK